MFCTQCGQQCPDEFVFCTNCGNRLHVIEPSEETPAVEECVIAPQEPAVQEPVWQEPVSEPVLEEPIFEAPKTTEYIPEEPAYVPQDPYAYGTEDYELPPFVPAPKKSKLPLIVGIFAVLAIAAVALFFLLGQSKAESLAVDYVTAMLEDDPDTIEELSFDDWDVDGDDKVYEDIELVDIEVLASYEIPKDFEYYEDDFDELSEELFDDEEVEEYHMVGMIFTIEYDGDEYVGEATARVYKCEGEWYVRAYTSFEDDFYEDYNGNDND